MLAVKENIRAITLEAAEEKETGQSFWILLDDNRNKIRIGVIYAPQEIVISNNKLKIMHINISKQISTGQEERQQVIILRDLNAKVDTYIEGNKSTLTKGGRQLMKVAKNYNLVVINKEKEVSKGLWTKVQGQKRSTLDYLLTNSKLL